MMNMHKPGSTRHLPFLPWLYVLIALGLAGCARGPKDVRYLESGKEFFAKKDYQRAAIQFRNAIGANPKNAEAHYQLGAVYTEQHNWSQAYQELNKALEINPNHRQAQVKLIILLASTNESTLVQQAQKRAQTFLAASPDDPDVLNALATADFKLGKPEDAIKALEHAASKAPQDLRTAVSLAKVRLQQNDAPGAERVLLQAVAHAPDSLEAHLILSSFYLALKKDAECERQVRWILAKDPNEGRALEQLAAVLEAHNRKPEAEQAYRKLSQLADPNYEPRYATYLFRNGRQTEAVAELERLFKLHKDDVAARTRLVDAYIATNRISDAERVLKRVLDKNPKDVDALIQRSRLDLREGKTDEARTKLNQALHFKPDSAQAHYLSARIHQSRGELLRQRQELGEAIRLSPDFLPARIQLAQALIVANAAQSALELMNQAPDQQKTSLDAIVQRNWALLALRQNSEARKEVNRALAIARIPDLLMQDADLKLQDQDYSGGRASLAEALNRNPDDLRPLRLLVASFVAQKQPASAIRAVRDYTNQHPKSAKAQLLLGELLMANHQGDQARMAVTAAKAADPGLTAADVVLAQLDAAEGRLAPAIKTLSAVVEKSPGDTNARAILGAYLDMAGNRAAAIAHYRKLVEAQPSNIIALNNLAFDLAESGNPDEALKYAQKAAELAPEAPGVENTLGWVLYQKGLYSMALPHLEKADKAEATAQRKCHLAMAYFKLGDEQRGRRTLQAAMRMNPNIPEIQTAQKLAESLDSAR